MAFVEVETRGNIEDAAYVVMPRQLSRIEAAAEASLMLDLEHAMSELRFDAILIALNTVPRNLPSTFDTTS